MRSLWTVWDDSTERRGAVDASSGWNAVTHDVEAREDWMSQQSLFRRQEKWRGWGGGPSSCWSCILAMGEILLLPVGLSLSFRDITGDS